MIYYYYYDDDDDACVVWIPDVELIYLSFLNAVGLFFSLLFCLKVPGLGCGTHTVSVGWSECIMIIMIMQYNLCSYVNHL